MPSASLIKWRGDRMPRLVEIESQCLAAPPSPTLAEENLRGFVVALMAHFQGFCRDLYTEAYQLIVAQIRHPAIEPVVQELFTADRSLDHANPNSETLKRSFKRLGLQLDLDAADPANAVRLQHLAKLGAWRNISAHQGQPTQKAGPLNLPLVSVWRTSCDGLATSLDGIAYNHLGSILGRQPW